MTTLTKPSAEPLGWKRSLLWLALAVACFHGAYTSVKYPAAGLLIFGYALGLVQLTHQPTVRRAFYFGLAVGFLCYAPQLFFFCRIFYGAAVVLWLVLAFWVGLFVAIACGALRRWGKVRAAWLIPVLWTGLEYFRSELYYLKFSWLNVGYALQYQIFGMYGGGLIVFGIVTGLVIYLRPIFTHSLTWRQMVLAVMIMMVSGLALLGSMTRLIALTKQHLPILPIVGIQLEFPQPEILPRALNHALAKHPAAQIFVLSEYTLGGPVPEALKAWCREHRRFLVVGGKDSVGTNQYYNTAFVIGTNGDLVFQQVKCVPIQFFTDGLRAPVQKVWNSPWGKIGVCVCYDLSYTRVTDELVRQGAQLLIVPTMDVEEWGRHQHELHARVAPVRAAEYGLPIFRLCSSGISQAVGAGGQVIAQAPMPGNGDVLAAQLRLAPRGSLPLDRWLAPFCTGVTGLVLAVLLFCRKTCARPPAADK